MFLRLTKEDIFSSHSLEQLEAKKKYLLDTLFSTSSLSSFERFEIHHLLMLIDLQKDALRETAPTFA